MARFKMVAEGDLFEKQELGSFHSLEEAAERAAELEELDKYFGYEFVLTDTLMHVEYFFAADDWHRS